MRYVIIGLLTLGAAVATVAVHQRVQAASTCCTSGDQYRNGSCNWCN